MMKNLRRYDAYDRKLGHVYLGEYASWGNKMKNAIAEAAYMISLERNGDVVRMASYAPLLAKKEHTQWKTDMIFFDNTSVALTPNYYVQKMFSANQGDLYFSNVVILPEGDTTVAASCVRESKTGDVILKLVNTSAASKTMKVDLSGFKQLSSPAHQSQLKGSAEAENVLGSPQAIAPVESSLKISPAFEYVTPPMSLTVLRIKRTK